MLGAVLAYPSTNLDPNNLKVSYYCENVSIELARAMCGDIGGNFNDYGNCCFRFTLLHERNTPQGPSHDSWDYYCQTIHGGVSQPTGDNNACL
ncbi:unnamed protein product [Zymoseptoria tritici ST99CH_1E4]|uniref:Uncharacterized protein n=1 Tax=Zymoseptoria tritici ST99CH_1E4 TaxID=1276532 RepID=A0A2H1GSP2_ZYMTR|nr:unnamed protein product [Zymoseptoria tritici ST99CH_1E4]